MPNLLSTHPAIQPVRAQAAAGCATCFELKPEPRRRGPAGAASGAAPKAGSRGLATGAGDVFQVCCTAGACFRSVAPRGRVSGPLHRGGRSRSVAPKTRDLGPILFCLPRMGAEAWCFARVWRAENKRGARGLTVAATFGSGTRRLFPSGWYEEGMMGEISCVCVCVCVCVLLLLLF